MRRERRKALERQEREVKAQGGPEEEEKGSALGELHCEERVRTQEERVGREKREGENEPYV